ncbi:hypothetical protein SAMN06295912_11866 [Sphingomonas laterariae]|uniref:Uncharacterized protein n=1 Tax=Edaphosphingomonas laterariae TaxID=861865 RepID=A0A239HTH9_9SPHN|nr:hypothetical protein [Sphingomonas laterariae]SNS83554.1 hypothetical protein SAMN06295912_11866 [Sphingomonas laterariae]
MENHAPTAFAPAPATPAPTPAQGPSLERAHGWTPQRQRDFLAALAEGHTVEAGCRIVGLSVASAYAFRRRAAGAAFALGWQAACLQAREKLADVLLSRAIDGQVETITRANGDVIERHRYDNRLAQSMLTRLDRLADAAQAEATHGAARMVAQEWDQYLALIGRDCSPARAGLFVGLRLADPAAGGAGAGENAGHDLAPVVALARADRFLAAQAGTAGEVDVADLDPARRGEWTGEQWARAEAAGLVAIAAPPPAAGDADDADGKPQLPQPLVEDDGCGPVWFSETWQGWVTEFPPPPGFRGRQDGDYGDMDYQRSLSVQEARHWHARRAAQLAGRRAADSADRDRFFGIATLLADADALAGGQPAGMGGDAATGDAALAPHGLGGGWVDVFAGDRGAGDDDDGDYDDDCDDDGDADPAGLAAFIDQCERNDATIERFRQIVGLADACDAHERGAGPDPFGLDAAPPPSTPPRAPYPLPFMG